MPCFFPVKCWYSRNINEDTGKRSLVFSENKGLSDTEMTVPCGKCTGCENAQRRDWANRIQLEARNHDKIIFPTFTYDPEHLPPGGTLVKAHPQKFIKALRKIIEPTHIRYFIAGEYGEQYDTNPINPLTGEHDIGRPHYHALIFGWEPDDLVHVGTNQTGDKIYTSEILERAWGHKGGVRIGTNVKASGAGAYCAKYCFKNLGAHHTKKYQAIHPETGEIIQRIQPFSLKSTRPGIGKKYFDDYVGQHMARGYLTIKGKNGRYGKHPMPRYYETLMERAANENDDYYPLWEQYKERKRTQYDPDHPDNSTERLRQRDEVNKEHKRRARQDRRNKFKA